jgi:hypothetical protein
MKYVSHLTIGVGAVLGIVFSGYASPDMAIPIVTTCMVGLFIACAAAIVEWSSKK